MTERERKRNPLIGRLLQDIEDKEAIITEKDHIIASLREKLRQKVLLNEQETETSVQNTQLDEQEALIDEQETESEHPVKPVNQDDFL